MEILNEGKYGVLESKKEEIKTKGKIRVLFLDCDGVINNMYQFREGHGGISLKGYGTASVNNIMPLNKLIDFLDDHGYYIVYSTAWNIGGSDRITKCLEDICDDHKLKRVVLGCTPYIVEDGVCRDGEIQHFMDNCGVEVERFAIVDDNNIKGFDDNFIKTEAYTGMLDYHVMRLMNILLDEDKRRYI